MNILLLGSGGREHVLAWKIAQSKKCEKLYIAPGNAGTASCGENVTLDIKDFSAVGKFSLKNNIDMVIVGPEEPLVNGIHDYFLESDELQGISVIGPQKEGAQLEGSKDFSKAFMRKYVIPTAIYQSFDRSIFKEGLAYIEQQTSPIVLKADGLAAGKGVLICETIEEAKEHFAEMVIDEKFGAASKKVVIEEYLSGIEFSVFIVTDGDSYQLFPVAKDYKRVGEGDTGLNTGGMGAVAPVPFVDQPLMDKVKLEIIDRTIAGLKSENIEYSGFLYFGLINVEGQPYVIEYNIRMGDPEAEVVIPLVKSDLVELFEGVANKELHKCDISFDTQTAATIMLVSGGYPGSYEKGKEITGIENAEDCLVFHAGTKSDDGGNVLTNGGRVLALTSFGKDISSALAISKMNADNIQFEKKYYRGDIGLDLL